MELWNQVISTFLGGKHFLGVLMDLSEDYLYSNFLEIPNPLEADGEDRVTYITFPLQSQEFCPPFLKWPIKKNIYLEDRKQSSIIILPFRLL